MRIVLFRPMIRTPERRAPGAAGAHVFAPDDIVLRAGQRKRFELGFGLYANQFDVPYYVRLADVPLLADLGIQLLGGVFDADYGGELYVNLYNCSDYTQEIPAGSTLAQLIIESIIRSDPKRCIK